MTQSRLHQLSALGQSVWIDSLSRDMLRSGELARLMEEDAVVGVTSNPTIFQKAIAEGDAYDEQLRQELEEERDPKELFIRLAAKDITRRMRPSPPGLGRRAAARTATSRSRSTRRSPTTPRRRSPRRSASTT